jgi:hypothetical protein
MTIQANFPTIKPSLNLDFANVGYLDPRITFTNSSNDRTYFDEFGVMQKAAANVPRFDHSPVTGESLGLLIEEQRTNIFTYSEQFDNAAWTKVLSTITANATTAPDGTSTADLLTETTGEGQHEARYPTPSLTDGVTYTTSIYAKSNGRYLQVIFPIASPGHNAVFDLVNGVVVSSTVAITAAIEGVGDGWYRCSLTSIKSGTGTATIRILTNNGSTALYTGDGTSGLYIWGAQLEVGAFPTSYIKTEASQVTRAADSAVMTGSNFSDWYNPLEGTFVFAVTSYSNATDTTCFCVDDGTTGQQNQLDVRYITSGTAARLRSRVAGVSVVDLQPASFPFGSSNKFAWGYKQDDFAASLNGGAVVTDTSGGVPSGMVRLRFAMRGTATSASGAWHFKRFAYYPRRLSDAQLQALTG